MNTTEALEMVIQMQKGQMDQLHAANIELREQNKSLGEKMDHLLARLAWFERNFFGKKSEKVPPMDPNQLSLFHAEEVALVEQKEEESKQASEQIKESTPVVKKDRKVRMMIEGLRVEEIVMEPENVDLTRYKRVGQEENLTLRYQPGEVYVEKVIRPKYALKDNASLPESGEKTFLIADLPLMPIGKGLPHYTLLAEILLQKYEYHMPFYRQIQSFKSLGFTISESTLAGWFKPACELLAPLYEELKKQILSTDYVQVDETTIPVIDKEKHKASKEYLWMIRSVMEKQVFFYYQEGSRSRKVVQHLFKNYTGYLQSDGYDGYNVLEEQEGVCLVGCLVHARRYWESAKNEDEKRAAYVLGEIQKIYHIERMADEQELSYKERAQLRAKLAAPILDSLEAWMVKTNSEVLPKSLIGKAVKYCYPLWPRMKVYLNDGRLKPDNNLAENAIRPIPLGRKNWMFCGNHNAAENMAIICSLLATCKAQDVNPREWLIDVLKRMPYYTKKKGASFLKPLLPNEWKKKLQETTKEIQ